jgi:hypothetical protein|tara:strand:- start:1621 stop:1869 length:249 start_codon:yes stop_codon:yes gene_type:complete
MTIIYGDFGKKENSLSGKLSTALKEVPNANDQNIDQRFLLIVDTGKDFKILSDVELPEFNVMLDICKFTVLQQAYQFLEENK